MHAAKNKERQELQGPEILPPKDNSLVGSWCNTLQSNSDYKLLTTPPSDHTLTINSFCKNLNFSKNGEKRMTAEDSRQSPPSWCLSFSFHTEQCIVPIDSPLPAVPPGVATICGPASGFVARFVLLFPMLWKTCLQCGGVSTTGCRTKCVHQGGTVY